MQKGIELPIPHTVKSVLVIKLRHIGDVLLTVPVFRAIKETFPGVRVTALVNAGTEEMLAGNPLVDEVIVFDRAIKKLPLLAKIARESSFIMELRSRNFDMSVDLTSGDRAALLSFFSGARYRLAHDPKRKGLMGKRLLYTHCAPKDGKRHMVLQNLEVVRRFGIDTIDERLDMRITAEADDFVSSLFARHGFTPDDTVVHVHPTSRWFFKCWKDEYMAEVISWMLDRGIKVVVTSSPDRREMEKGARIMSLVTSTAQPVNLLGGTSLKQLAALSKRSALFLGVDSAPMHMAAAVQTPVVALFGPSHEALWSPWGENATVIAPPMACKPCRKGSCEGVDLRECMTAITPEAVISAIQEKLHVH